ncbi:Uncharacterized protein FWK35_00009294 [Aphis craccivora]|uniref:Uncharacterized protein n=1 Tax=Aphis craccivora TaxID=307492 RepID=A0A6G0ZJ97_APHCR|nr:Uncharacterized protein FWK35_00009294 [Aphis craccivora]
MFNNFTTIKFNGIIYVISNEIAKSKKSLSDGEFIKNCAIKMAKSTNENRIATLDESTDVSDVSQLLIFVRVISSQFEMYEKLLELCSLHGSTKGIDIFNAVKNAIEPFGVFKITNLIRGGNRSLNHRNFIKFLEELDCEYGDLLLHTDVRWLSRGKCLELEIKKQDPSLQLELWTTFLCQCTFSNLKHIKSKERNRLTDETLGHILRVSTTEIQVDFTELSFEKPHF